MQRCAGLLAVEKFSSAALTRSRRQKTVGVCAGASSTPLSLARSSFCHATPPRSFSRIRAANGFPLKSVFPFPPSPVWGFSHLFTVNADAFSVNGSEACWCRCCDFSPDGADNVAEFMRAVNNVGVCVCIFIFFFYTLMFNVFLCHRVGCGV